MADKDEVSKSSSNETNLLNLSASKKSTRAGYLTSKDVKKGGNNPKKSGGNTKKGIKAAKRSNYLIPGAKKPFNLLRHAFT